MWVCNSYYSDSLIFWQIQKGSSGARADDTKGMKSAIVDWITPKGQSLNPHISCNVKSARGFNHERTGALLCPAGLDWANTEYVFCHFHRSALFITWNLKDKDEAC
jgi:hypothetical protein